MKKEYSFVVVVPEIHELSCSKDLTWYLLRSRSVLFCPIHHYSEQQRSPSLPQQPKQDTRTHIECSALKGSCPWLKISHQKNSSEIELYLENLKYGNHASVQISFSSLITLRGLHLFHVFSRTVIKIIGFHKHTNLFVLNFF